MGHDGCGYTSTGFLVSGLAVLINTPSKLQTTLSLSASAMRPPWFLLSVIIVIHSAVDVTAGKEQRSNVNGTSATILTPDVVQAVQEIVDSKAVLGGSVVLFNKTKTEFLAFGVKSENGTNMTTDVS